MDIAIIIGVIGLVAFLLRPRKPSPIARKYSEAAEYVHAQLKSGVPLDEAQQRARRLYGIDDN